MDWNPSTGPTPEGYYMGTDAILGDLIDSSGEQSNYWITGGAGSGKSYFLQTLKMFRDNMVIVAPTGVAALNVGGMTAHKTFGLSFGISNPASLDQATIGKGKRVLKSKHTKTLVIDEISMVRADKFWEMDCRLRALRRCNKPFGGLQVIVIGDFFQAAPIVANNEKFLFQQFWPDGELCFNTQVWKDLNFRRVILTDSKRQQSVNFATMLNCVRLGVRKQEVVSTLNQLCYHPDKINNGIILCATNAQADQYNKVEFEKIKERVQVKCAVVKGTFDTKKPPVEQRMELKVGQKVMLAVNDTDSPNGEKKLRFYNGSLAIIKKIGRNSIYVDIEKTGETVEIVRHEWKQMKYTIATKKNEKGEEIKYIKEKPEGSFTQFPFKPGYAITVHRCVAEGSRVKTPSGMVSIENLSVGDVVHTGLEGYRKVIGKSYTGKKESLTIKTKTGSEICCSLDHEVYVLDEDGARFEKASNIKEGMFVAKSLDPYIGGEGSDLAYVLGALIGDGNINNDDERDYRIELFGMDLEVHKEFIATCKKYGVNTATRAQKSNTNVYGTYCHSKHFRLMLKDTFGLGYCTAQQKYIPEVVFGWNEASRWEVLSGLWDTDGCTRRVPRYVTVSQRLAKDVQNLLASVGITSCVSKQITKTGVGESYTVVVHKGLNLKNFCKGINLRVSNKKESLEKLVATGSSKTETDVVPSVKGVGERGGRLFGSTKQCISREQAISRKGEIKGLLQKNFMWDRVEKIENTGTKNMWDIEVDVDHTFTVDNIITHNCQGLTLDEYNIDLGRGAFTTGMTYVALSRARTAKGIVLLQPLKVSDILVDQRVARFYEESFPNFSQRVEEYARATAKK